jgi:hypothetical protein
MRVCKTGAPTTGVSKKSSITQNSNSGEQCPFNYLAIKIIYFHNILAVSGDSDNSNMCDVNKICDPSTSIPATKPEHRTGI